MRHHLLQSILACAFLAGAPLSAQAQSADPLNVTIPGAASQVSLGTFFGATGSQYSSGILAANPYVMGGVRPPDTLQAYYAVTTTAGSKTVILASANSPPWRPLTSADVGKLIQIVGPGSEEQGHFNSTIAAVAQDGQTITMADPVPLTVDGKSLLVTFGSDQYLSLKGAIDAGVASGAEIPAGVYMISTPLACNIPAAENNFLIGSPLCQASPAAYILYMGPHTTNVIQYGTPDYTGYIQFGTAYGWTIDANFRADYGSDFPFFNGLSRIGQTVENALLGGTRYGNLAAPKASAGSQDEFTNYERATYGIPIASISSSSTAPQICTDGADHGFQAGRVIAIEQTKGFPTAPPGAAVRKWFQIAASPAPTARCFTLVNTDTTSWGAYTKDSATVFETMKSMQIDTSDRRLHQWHACVGVHRYPRLRQQHAGRHLQRRRNHRRCRDLVA